MFDLETLDVLPTATILTLGAVKFNPLDPYTFDNAPTLKIRFDVDDQSDLNRTVSDSTLEWWSKQPAHIQEEAFSGKDRVRLNDAVTQFHKFVWNTDYIWSQGSFDVNIMENLYRSLNRVPPWNYWQVCDSRTFFNIVDGNVDKTNLHDALADAVEQAKGLCRALKKIGWQGQKL